MTNKSMEKEIFKQITNEMLDLYIKKNTDYGSSVTDTYKDYGLVAFLVRMSDKMNRLKTLYRQPAQVSGEKIEDTLLDLANYAILAMIEIRREAKENSK